MKIAVGCDHRGLTAKQLLLRHLREMGHRFVDFGCHDDQPVDFPDIAYPAALAVASRRCDSGILIDCNGMGMAMVANKVKGVRAASVHNEYTARCAREFLHCNVISIGVDFLSSTNFHEAVAAFLAAKAEPGRHARRTEKLAQIEESLAVSPGANLDNTLWGPRPYADAG